MAPSGRTVRTTKKRDAFLTELAKTANVSEAAARADMSRSAVYAWRREDAEFAAEWDDAVDQAADRMEREALRRAVEGVDEPVYYQGEEVGAVRKYSDTLLIFLLKAARPEKYRERQDVKLQGDIAVKGYAIKEASPDAWDDPPVE